jgi:hypothetical protein
MTHPAKAIVASLLFSTVLCTNSFAQQSIVSLESVYDKNNSELLTHNTTPVAVNTNTKASFDALFPNATMYRS